MSAVTEHAQEGHPPENGGTTSLQNNMLRTQKEENAQKRPITQSHGYYERTVDVFKFR